MWLNVTWIHSARKFCSYIHVDDHYLTASFHPCLVCYSVCKFCSYIHADDHNNLTDYLIPLMSCVLLDAVWIHSGCKFCSYIHADDHYLTTSFHPCLVCCWMWLGFTQDVSFAHTFTLYDYYLTTSLHHVFCVVGCGLDSLRM